MYRKGYHLSMEGIRKGYLFLSKKFCRRVGGWTSGRSLPYKTSLLSTSTIPPGMILNVNCKRCLLMAGFDSSAVEVLALDIYGR